MLLRDILNHAVKLYPDKTAIIDGDVHYTYRESADRIHRLAAGLISLGLRPGDHIAILANNSHRYFETYFVADIAGMPLAPLNIRLAAAELEFILNDGEIKALILGPEYLELYSHFKAGTPNLQHVILLNGGGPFGLQGHRPGMGKWKDDGYRASMHNGIYESIREIAAQRGWRLYTPRDLAAGVQLPGFGTPALPGGWGPMLGPGGGQ